MFTDSDAEALLASFPEMDFAFAYGSGAITQASYDYSTASSSSGANLPMLDFIFAVEDSNLWHADNMILNPQHYTPLIPLSARQTAFLQERTGAGVWFNSLVPLGLASQPSRLMKYGVISTKQLRDDLCSWRWLYAAGRLHKPVHVLKQHSMVWEDVLQNRSQALAVALLLQEGQEILNRGGESGYDEDEDEDVQELRLYSTIAGLSYTGDIRMAVGAENPNKVNNLVTGAMSQYRHVYIAAAEHLAGRVHHSLPLLQRLASPLPPSTTTATSLSCPDSGKAKALSTLDWHSLISTLPPSLIGSIPGALMLPPSSSSSSSSSSSAAAAAAAVEAALPPDSVHVKAAQKVLRSNIKRTVAAPALTQSLKGLLSIGARKAGTYLLQKLAKGKRQWIIK